MSYLVGSSSMSFSANVEVVLVVSCRISVCSLSQDSSPALRVFRNLLRTPLRGLSAPLAATLLTLFPTRQRPVRVPPLGPLDPPPSAWLMRFPAFPAPPPASPRPSRGPLPPGLRPTPNLLRPARRPSPLVQLSLILLSLPSPNYRGQHCPLLFAAR